MLFLPPASSRCIRLHGPYISEQESARLASFLRKQGKPIFDETITAEDDKTGPEGLQFEKDELYDEAARIVVSSGQASISYLQRKLRIGFSRAARLVDMMEAEGSFRRAPAASRARSSSIAATSRKLMPSFGNSSPCGADLRHCGADLSGPRVIARSASRWADSCRRRCRTPRKLIHEAEVRESALRREIDTREAGALATPLLDRARTLVRSFEDISRLFASSPYGDDALWHGAMLAADAFWEFGQPDDRTTAVRLLKALGTRCPRSSLVKQAGPQLDRLNAVERVVAAVEPKQTAVMLKTIRREALAGAVRVTLELEGEATFHDEEIDSPHRVFIELQNTRPVEALKDVTQSFTDDLVRQIRVGRQIGTRTRIAVDLNAAAPHTVYALYAPIASLLISPANCMRTIAPKTRHDRTDGRAGHDRTAKRQNTIAPLIAIVAPTERPSMNGRRWVFVVATARTRRCTHRDRSRPWRV